MKDIATLMILGCLILAAMAVYSVANHSADFSSLRSLRKAFGLHTGILRVNALTDGIHADGKIGHLLADAALSTRYLLVKEGSDAAHFAACGAGDQPIGVCLDEPSAAEEAAAIGLLGAVKGTMLMVGSEAITKGQPVYTAANGKVQNEPGTAGTYYKVGQAITDCSGDGGVFEVVPCLPQLVKVIANGSTLAQTQAAMVNGAIVIVLGA